MLWLKKQKDRFRKFLNKIADPTWKSDDVFDPPENCELPNLEFENSEPLPNPIIRPTCPRSSTGLTGGDGAVVKELSKVPDSGPPAFLPAETRAPCSSRPISRTQPLPVSRSLGPASESPGLQPPLFSPPAPMSVSQAYGQPPLSVPPPVGAPSGQTDRETPRPADRDKPRPTDRDTPWPGDRDRQGPVDREQQPADSDPLQRVDPQAGLSENNFCESCRDAAPPKGKLREDLTPVERLDLIKQIESRQRTKIRCDGDIHPDLRGLWSVMIDSVNLQIANAKTEGESLRAELL